jgi:hypothetical protein
MIATKLRYEGRENGITFKLRTKNWIENHPSKVGLERLEKGLKLGPVLVVRGRLLLDPDSDPALLKRQKLMSSGLLNNDHICAMKFEELNMTKSKIKFKEICDDNEL